MFYKDSDEKKIQSEKKVEKKKKLTDLPPRDSIKRKPNKRKDGNLSELSEMGQARKDKSEIISFFFDLFEDDGNEKSSNSTREEKSKKLDKVVKDNKQEVVIKKVIMQDKTEAEEKISKTESFKFKKKEIESREINNNSFELSDKNNLDAVNKEIEIEKT